jgi:hypothetical protein
MRIDESYIPCPCLYAVLVLDPSVRDCMHHMHAVLADFLRQSLGNHPCCCSAGAVGVVLRIRSDRTERTGEDDRAFFASVRLTQRRLPAMVRVDTLEGLLRKRERPCRVYLQALAESAWCLLEERLLRGVLDMIDREFER